MACKLVTSPRWSDRCRASKRILKAPDFDTLTAFNIIIRGIKAESDFPAVPILAEILGGANIQGWDDILYFYIHDLVTLGAPIMPHLVSATDTSLGKMRTWLIIARGLLGDSLIHGEIKNLSLENSDPNIRAMAIEALGTYSSQDDFEIFRTLLSDTAKFFVRSDVSIDGGKTLAHHEIYPVRLHAIYALRKLGFTVTPDSSGGYIVKEKK